MLRFSVLTNSCSRVRLVLNVASILVATPPISWLERENVLPMLSEMLLVSSMRSDSLNVLSWGSDVRLPTAYPRWCTGPRTWCLASDLS